MTPVRSGRVSGTPSAAAVLLCIVSIVKPPFRLLKPVKSKSKTAGGGLRSRVALGGRFRGLAVVHCSVVVAAWQFQVVACRKATCGPRQASCGGPSSLSAACAWSSPDAGEFCRFGARHRFCRRHPITHHRDTDRPQPAAVLAPTRVPIRHLVLGSRVKGGEIDCCGDGSPRLGPCSGPRGRGARRKHTAHVRSRCRQTLNCFTG